MLPLHENWNLLTEAAASHCQLVSSLLDKTWEDTEEIQMNRLWLLPYQERDDHVLVTFILCLTCTLPSTFMTADKLCSPDCTWKCEHWKMRPMGKIPFPHTFILNRWTWQQSSAPDVIWGEDDALVSSESNTNYKSNNLNLPIYTNCKFILFLSLEGKTNPGKLLSLSAFPLKTYCQASICPQIFQ